MKLLAGWAVFVAIATFAIWLAKPGHPFYFAAGTLTKNHRIGRRDLIPSPGGDSPLLRTYVRVDEIWKWTLVWPQDLAEYPTVVIPEGKVAVRLPLEGGIVDALNAGAVIDVWDGITRVLEAARVLAVTCDRQACQAIVAIDSTPAGDIAKAKMVWLLIRSY
jgi:hypothetical protein